MLQPLRYAFRRLRESPGFAITAILSLTLGIGASTAMFGVLDSVLLRPLPFAEPDRLVAIASQPDRVISIPTMQDYQSGSTTFQNLAAYRPWGATQRTVGAPAARLILEVSQSFFNTLGTRFALGTDWPITGNERDCSAQAIVSDGYWKQLGGGSYLDKRILRIDERDFEIAGVLPQEQAIEGDYSFNHPDVFVQIGCDREAQPEVRGDASFEVIGRLRSRATLAQANADLARIDQILQREYPNDYGARRTTFRHPPIVFPYIDLIVGVQTKPALLMTFGACGLLLTIACANLTSILLARNTRRRSEFATRSTLGASLGHLLAQLVTESAVLVAPGAAGGIAVALVILELLRKTTAVEIPRLGHASMQPIVLLFVLSVSSLITVILTLLPAWRTLRRGLLQDIQGMGRASVGPSLRLLGRGIVVAQLTLTTVLIACAGWMIGGVYLLLHQPLGFTPDHLLMFKAQIGREHQDRAQANDSEKKLAEIVAALEHLPGVVSVALTDHQPLGHAVNRYDFCSDAHPEQCKEQVNINPNSYAISPRYFFSIGQTLLEGRDFTDSDDGRNRVVIVNRALAEREWPGESALGHRIRTGEIHSAENQNWATVIGVVDNIHSYDLSTAPGPDLYIPRSEAPSRFSRVVVNTTGDPAILKNTIRKAMKAEFPGVSAYAFETMTEEMSYEVQEREFLMRIATAFGAVALFLSVLGIYGLLAYEVASRVKEIGIRLALGSTRERIIRLLVCEHGTWLLVGTILGLCCAIGTGYFFRSRFYGMQSSSSVVLFGSAVILLLPALLAISLPARRASLQDPANTLRQE